MNETQARQLSEIHIAVKRLTSVIDGDPDRDIKGLRPRVSDLEATMETLLDERDRIVNYARGAMWGIGLNILANIVLIIAVIRFFVERP